MFQLSGFYCRLLICISLPVFMARTYSILIEINNARLGSVAFCHLSS